MFAQNELHRQTRSRLWANRLWVLSGVLGATTLGATAAIIHDSSRQTAAAHLVARATAQQVATVAAGRFEILALETFAPVSPWDVKRVDSPSADLDALARAQAQSAACRCRDSIAVDAFFQFDVASGKLDVNPTIAARRDAPISAAAIGDVARHEAERARSLERMTSHFVAPASLAGRGAVMVVQTDEQGAPRTVHGLVGDASRISKAVFGTIIGARATLQPPAPMFMLDSSSLEVRTEGAPTAILGDVPASHSFRATVFPKGPLEGLGLTVALTPQQAIHSMFVSQRELWHLGVLTLATIFAIAFAVGSSRREVLLARARSDFIAGVSHDLRMPLAQILIAGETLTLKRDRDPTDRDKLSSSIVREARRLVSIVDNVLLFSRSGAVALKPRLEPLSIHALFDDVTESVKLAVDDAGQTIEADDRSLAILGDRQLLRQAIVNLIDNALKYGAPGQRIRLGAEETEASHVRLFVEDEGPGVPASERARIFEPYERLARDQTSERTGTGLGLAVVRHIAQVCGGRVWIDDAYTRGTRAVIELPATVVREVAPAEKELV